MSKIKFELRSLPPIGGEGTVNLCLFMQPFFEDVSAYPNNLVIVKHDGDCYGIRKVGSVWYGFKKPGETGDSPNKWDGIFDHDFECDSTQEAAASLIYFIMADGDVEEFHQILREVSYITP